MFVYVWVNSSRFLKFLIKKYALEKILPRIFQQKIAVCPEIQLYFQCPPNAASLALIYSL